MTGTTPRRLIDLEDFGAAPGLDTDGIAATDAASAEPELDPNLVTIHRDDIASMRDAAFREGQAHGAREREETLHAEFAARISALATSFEAESIRRQQVVADATGSFVATVVAIIRGLTALDGTVLEGLERDLVADAACFAKDCEGDVTIRCQQADARSLQPLIGAEGRIRIDIVPDTEPATIGIVSAANSIVIDPEQWRQSVADKIVTAVAALAGQRAAQRTPKP
ncbi:hypothetical protein AA12717_1852 [Gluconacetobacter sacchari DSM 12717]|uniref:Flagellar assembly protein FliH n=2 Tax=Gluconacetobacter sacchari TaxID=92759 RepID=A0A7W4I986_9PROT|nr:hypothetical protein [Gluconacetobacter sacchari]MBB2158616.1 hypothetical protein [Gluconacetobacter sacchari]GBQ24659.1 hypothetical protein AA12717_1852 [Gluconacetobacter sacchari DSM 12717]